MARILLLLPTTTYRAADFIAAARALRADVVIASDQPPLFPGVAPNGALEVDFADPEGASDAIHDLARRVPIDAVVPVDDGGVITAALAAEKLGLRHNGPEPVRLTRDKAASRSALSRTNVLQPDFDLVYPDSGMSKVSDKVRFPWVLKPLSLSASQGVIRVDDRLAAVRAADRISAILDCENEQSDRRLLTEHFISGDEVAVEGIVRAGVFEPLAIFDKPDPLDGPYFEETLYVTPSRHTEWVQREIIETARNAVALLGLTDGPVHAEMRVNGSGVWLLEVAARSIGGLCSRSIQFGLGFSLEELILRNALGMPTDNLGQTWPASGVMMLPIPRAGRLREVTGQQEALKVSGIAGLEITVATGRQVQPLPEGDRYLGFLFARGETADDVERSLRSAYSRLEISID